jgi:predicted 2-oxoglutarate/Fe(II)-dependent dioxygenase YbiX
MHNILDYIIVIENAVPDSLCDAILQEYKNSDEWKMGYMNGEIREDLRNCKNIPISEELVIKHNQQTRNEIDIKLFNIASSAITSYIQKFKTFNIEKDEGYTLLRYETGQYIKSHIDTGSSELNKRKISCSFCLNDNYSGGEFAFFNKEYILKLKKGSILLFPSNFMFPHEVLEVTSGTRFSIITWFR